MYEKIYENIRQSIRKYEKQYNIKDFWRSPLLAFLSARDERLAKLKESVSPTHLTSDEVLPDAESIVVFYIPYTEAIVESNTGPGPCSRLWAETYIRTNELIGFVSANIAALLARHGARVAAVPATHNFDEERLVSDWSHRHIAVLAGLGSFGLNNMLITSEGCCGRLGSVVTDMKGLVPASPAPIQERCPYKLDGSCGLCVKKCADDAFRGGSFGRARCYHRCLENAVLYKDMGLADVCGKCLCGLPCSMRSPAYSRPANL